MIFARSTTLMSSIAQSFSVSNIFSGTPYCSRQFVAKNSDLFWDDGKVKITEPNLLSNILIVISSLLVVSLFAYLQIFLP